MSTNSKDTTDKKDEDVAAKNKDLQNLRNEVGIVKKYINAKKVEDDKTKTDVESAKKYIKDKTDKEVKEAYESNRLSKKIKGLGKLEGLNLGLGQQSFKK
jgi:predicted  nucleic acid-binding Zn-ribbon protein